MNVVKRIVGMIGEQRYKIVVLNDKLLFVGALFRGKVHRCDGVLFTGEMVKSLWLEGR